MLITVLQKMFTFAKNCMKMKEFGQEFERIFTLV